MGILSQVKTAGFGNIEVMKPEVIYYSGDNLRKTRIKRNMSQTDVAKAIGTKRSTIQIAESEDGNPTVKTLGLIGGVLNVEIKIRPVQPAQKEKSPAVQPGT